VGVEDIVLWRRRLRGVEFAVRSPETSRPNPLAADSLLFASIWSPGAICALDRTTGRAVWRRPAGRFAYDSVCLVDGILYDARV
jgi:hypothetical protein